MEQRVSFITLAVHDLAASHRFYAEGLGWTPEFHDPREVLMFRAGPQTVLSLWDRVHFEAEVGAPAQSGPGVVPVTLSHNVGTRGEVDAVLEDARAAGASEVSGAVERAWGGCTGYFADPDGFRWEVAWNPGPVGQLVLPPVSDTT
jgi:catechol 2,3-dioxygenase-like lactoylglutathione lyase family enzyme